MTQEDLIEVIHINGQERLLFKAIPLDIAFIRGTYADESGNVTLEREVASLEATSMAQAVHNCGGKVIVQVERLVQDGTLDPSLVKIPGIYVDGIVVCKVPDDHAQSLGCEYDGSMCGEFPRRQYQTGIPCPCLPKKIIGRRAAMELSAGKVVNLGICAPEYVALVAGEEGISNCITLTVEGGPVGGIPQAGVRFGACVKCRVHFGPAISV
jgi:propionate CoA-transferase